jgi:CBS domain-containing protein
VFRADAPLATLLAHLRPGEQTTFPVVDPAGALLGVVTMGDLARLKEEAASTEDGRVAADVAGPIEAVTLSDTLLEAIRRMGVRGSPVLPVLAPNGQRLLGIVSRSHILAAYERALGGGPPPDRPPAGGAARQIS